MPVTVGYCTNIHAGATLAATLANLETYSARVREIVCPEAVLPIGLWLSAEAVGSIRPPADTGMYRLDFTLGIERLGLRVFTLNAFPFGDFHSDVVKHDVYRPHWGDKARLDYTVALLISGLDLRGLSLSTLPVGWPSDLDPVSITNAAKYMKAWAACTPAAAHCHLDIEPEPGCFLQRSDDVVAFFGAHQLDPDRIRVCHDICHAAVMFEDQKEMLARYDAAGVRIGKVQVSSAVRATFDTYDDVTRADAMQKLREFNEPRYLHQTVIRFDDGTIEQFDDLPDALRAHGDEPRGEWRVHFHVPIFAESLGPLGTTQHLIDEALALFRPRREIEHYEVETYAWDVLPDDARGDDLAEDIARELRWLWDRMDYAPGGVPAEKMAP